MDVARVGVPLVSLPNLLIWQLPFVCGVVASRTEAAWPTRPGPREGAALMAVLVGLALIERLAPALLTPALIVLAPVCVLALHRAVAGRAGPAARALRFLGRLSLPLWLVHPFFCFHFFQDLTYAPRWSPLVFANLLVLTLATVLALEALRGVLVGALTGLGAAAARRHRA